MLLMCSEAVLHEWCPWWVLIALLKPYWLQEAAEMPAPSTHEVRSEQHDAELWAAGHFQLSLEIINKAARKMEDRFAIGGCETIAQPVLLVHKSQDPEKTVKSVKSGLRS